MIPRVSNIGKFTVTYFNKEEFKNLKKEIFHDEIYSIDLNTQNPIIFDAGAHIGLSTLYFKSIYPNANITCFEPNPNVIELLKENIFLNNIKCVTIQEIALGKRKCEKDFFVDSSGYGAFSTASFRKDAWDSSQKSKAIKVNVEKLSKYIDRDIDVLKIDVEGGEKDILEDLVNSNCLKRVRNIIMEYHPIKNRKIGKIVSILEENNYTLEYKKDGKFLKKPKEDLILVVAKKIIK